MTLSNSEKCKRWREKHPGRQAESYRKYYLNNVDFLLKRSRNNYMRNKEALKKQAHDYYWKLRIKAIEKLGGKCISCGIDDIRILQINHKNGGGTKELKSISSIHGFYKDIINGARNISDLEIRCANDNIIYEYEAGRRRAPI